MSAGNVEQQFATTLNMIIATFIFNHQSAITKECGITGNVDKHCYANIQTIHV